MTTQVRNDQMVELLRADFFARNEPNAAWSHTVSDHLLLPALRGFWPMSANHATANGVFVDDIACGYDLEMINTPEIMIGIQGLLPCVHFTSANSEYLTYGADDIQHDILGTETNVIAAQRGLAMGCWVHFATLGATVGIMGKWAGAGNQRSYSLYKTAANVLQFYVSGNGIASVVVSSAAVIAAGIWYHVVCRYVPSTTIDIYVDGVRTSNAVGTPASLFNSTQPLEMAIVDAGNYLNGYLSLAWLAASTCWDGAAGTRDVIPWCLYEHSKRLFNK